LFLLHPWQGVNLFLIKSNILDVKDLTRQVRDDSAGGFVSFEGWVRNHNQNKEVRQLEYEVYHELALKEGAKIIDQALKKFAIVKAACVHREGLLQIQDLAVWVGVSSVHRGEAFKACEYIINQIKVCLPIWKKEYYQNGDSGWVNCEHCSVHAH